MVGSARLRAGAHLRALPPTKRLAAHNRTGDTAVNVHVAGLHVVKPVRDFVAIERVDAGGQAELHRVLDLECLLERIHPHNRQYGAEVLGHVRVGAGLDALSNARRPQPSRVVLLLGLEQPALARFKLGETALELAGRGLDDWAHLGGRIRRPINHQRVRRVNNLVDEPLGFAHRPHQNRKRGRRTLLARMPERRIDDVPRRQIDIRLSRHDDRVLAGRLRRNLQIRLPRAEQLGRLDRTGEDHLIGPRHERLAHLIHLIRMNIDEHERLAGHARIPQRLGDHGATAARLLGGLEQHHRPGGQRRERRAGWDRQREVPRRNRGRQLLGRELHALDLLELLGQIGIVVRKVNRLGDLHIRLGHDLATLRTGHLNELGAALTQNLGGPAQHVGALLRGLVAPSARILASLCDDLVHLLDRPHARRVRRRRTQIRIRHLRENLVRPLHVVGERRIGIRRVRETLLLRHVVRQAVLRTVGTEVKLRGVLAQRRQILGQVRFRERSNDAGREPVAFEGEDRLVVGNVEDAGHEVLVCGALFQAAHEIGDGDVVVVRIDDGHVVQDLAHVLADGERLVGGHALEHLDVEALGDAAGLGELEPEREREQVLTCDTELDVLDVLGAQSVLEHTDVVRIRGRLRGLNR